MLSLQLNFDVVYPKVNFFLFFVSSVLALIEMATHQPNWCLISGRVGGGMGDNLKIWQCWKMKTLSYPQLYKHILIFFGDGCLIILSINPVHSEKPIFFLYHGFRFRHLVITWLENSRIEFLLLHNLTYNLFSSLPLAGVISTSL